MEWPTQNPDLTLIKMLWHYLIRVIHTKHPNNIAKKINDSKFRLTIVHI